MKNNLLIHLKTYCVISVSLIALLSENNLSAESIPTIAANESLTAKQELTELYDYYVRTKSDINEHVPVLRKLCKECSSVVEIGIRRVVPTWGIFLGLSENNSPHRFYLGIDLRKPELEKFYLLNRLAKDSGISFLFQEANEMTLDIPQTDMLFIDSLHTYAHLTYELEKFSPKVNKYITLHDTSPPWGYKDDTEYHGDFSEYPSHINRTKKGLWPAVEDFLASHSEWELIERRFNNHGFTILKRKNLSQ